MQPAGRLRWNSGEPNLAAAREHGFSHAAAIAAGAIFLLHFALIAASIFDYRVTIDSAYHISIARQWGEHWLVPWDTINFGPAGRPNLQGPLFQAMVGWLGRMIGGTGRDYLLANAVAAVAQWTAAIATAGFFALQLGGQWAAVFAIALLSGAAFSSSSFALGIPSGWLFILSGWAAWFFLRGRTACAAIAASAAIYMHVAGFAMAPAVLLIAAVLTRRWTELFRAGLITAVLTAPYAIHLARYLGWFGGDQEHAALLFDPMLDLAGIAASAMILRRPRQNAFFVAWMLGPLVWLMHDPCRLILQSGLALSVAAGVMLERALTRIGRRRALLFGAVAGAATVFPLGIPALAPELSWDLGLRYPRAIDWTQAQALGAEIAQSGLQSRLIADYEPALCPAIAVFTPISCEKGHWIEVAPREDRSDEIAPAQKAFIVPLPADDPVLLQMQSRGWVQAHGSAGANTLITIAPAAPPHAAALMLIAVLRREAEWLGRNAINNTIRFDNLDSLLTSRSIQRRERALRAQRVRSGRIQLALLVYAAANPAQARRLYKIARGFGVIAGFLSDGFAIDYISEIRLAGLKRSLIALAAIAHTASPLDPKLIAAMDDSLAQALDLSNDTLCGRPAGNAFPWILHSAPQ